MKNQVMNKFILITVLCALSACNAMKGLGKDIQHLGSSLEKTAQMQQNSTANKPPPPITHNNLPQQTMQAVPVDPVVTKDMNNTLRFNGH